MISSREMHLISLADTAGLPTSASIEEKVCVICHEGLLCGQRLAATGCGHVFCAGCISMGLRHKDECPTCRTRKPSVTVLYIWNNYIILTKTQSFNKQNNDKCKKWIHISAMTCSMQLWKAMLPSLLLTYHGFCPCPAPYMYSQKCEPTFLHAESPLGF